MIGASSFGISIKGIRWTAIVPRTTIDRKSMHTVTGLRMASLARRSPEPWFGSLV